MWMVVARISGQWWCGYVGGGGSRFWLWWWVSLILGMGFVGLVVIVGCD